MLELSSTASFHHLGSSLSSNLTNGTLSISAECQQTVDLEHPEQMYVNLSSFWYSFLALITTIGLLVSLVSNMIIIYLFTRTPSLRSNPSNIIAANLSFSDLLYCIQWPSVIYCSLTQSTWILEAEYVCQAFGFITVSTALASILTVLAMSIERAIVIKYSIYVKDRFTIKLAWLIIVIIWSIALVSCLPPLFGKFNRYTLDPSKTSCTLDYLSKQTNYRLYIRALAGLYWFAPATLIIISYALIIITFKRSSLSLKKVASSEFQSSSNRQHLSSSCSTSSSPGIRSGAASSAAVFVEGRQKRVLRDSIRIRNFITSIHRPASTSGANDDQGAAAATAATTFGRSAKREHTTRRASASALDLKQAVVAKEQLEALTINGMLGDWQGFKRVASSSILPLEAGSHSNLGSTPLSTSAGQQAQSTPTNNSAAAAAPLSPRQRGFNNFGNPLLRLKRFSRGSIRSCQMGSDGRSKRFNDLRCSGLGAILNKNIIPLHRGQGPTKRGTASSSGSRNNNAPNSLAQAANSQLTRTVLQFRLAKMSFYVILLWFISWTPIASLAFINSIISCHRASATAVFMASTMTKLGPAFDVFIYGISHPKIKSKFKQVIKWLFMMGDNPSASLAQNHENSAQTHNVGNPSMKSQRANSIETQMSLNL